MGNLAKDTTELDLWAFDEAEPPESPDTEAPSAAAVPPPEPSEKLKVRQIKGSASPKGTKSHEGFQTNVSRVRPKSSPGNSPSVSSKAGRDFDDLDHWEDNGPLPEIGEISELDASPPEESIEPAQPAGNQPSVATTAPEADASEEISPAPLENSPPVSSRPRLNLTKVELIGLVTLLAILVLGAGSIVIFSLNRLPTESAWGNANNFPIKGQYIKILSAESYWRAPILDGKTPDIVRRGTVLLPVLNLATSDGAAGIRVIFRKDDGESIGDIVTRKVQSGQKLEIAATAGFDDIGMHSAYRTGESKPWMIEVYEAPTVDSPNAAFKKLFEMKISTDRR